MYGIFYNLYLYTLDFFLDLQKIKNYKNNIIKKNRGNSVVVEKKKKKPSSQGFAKILSGAGGISWPTMGVLILLLSLIITTTVNVARIGTRLETQLTPLVNADLPKKISTIETQSNMIFRLVMFKDIVDQLKEDTIKYLNPEIKNGLIVFLEKMKEEEFTKINNSSQLEIQKVIEIIVEIGGIEKLMDLLGTKNHSFAYGVVFLFVENYDFSKN